MAPHLAGSGRPPPPLASAHRARTGRLHELGPRDFSPTRPHRTRDRVRAARPPLHPAGRKLPRFRRTPRRAGRAGGAWPDLQPIEERQPTRPLPIGCSGRGRGSERAGCPSAPEGEALGVRGAGRIRWL